MLRTMAGHGSIRFKFDELLAARGWSNYRLAKESGVQAIVIAKYRTNAVQAPPLETLAKLCAALECGICDLMEYVPEKAKPHRSKSRREK